ncbi:anaphase-promoting complex subunit 15B-like [Mizuhopecten yessoensis]|uniref:anaphase-promoting complex subunit 15B-like n=1 Tax=Mizuhopecten yessoensis TaxID=6573 RepID=UPI000B45A073|nr:anaphase-promoting complex subunit 15B-like [Mizuhopecten yessoensis]
MAIRFPSLLPGAVDPLWFTVDRPCDDENELSELEEEHNLWLESIAKKDSNIIPIGKTAVESLEDEEEDEEDDEGDDDDESDTNDDDLDIDMLDERDSGDDAG